MENRKIGILDTGVGGLYSLSKIRRRTPNASLLYVGDCRNLPHNIHPKEWICEKAQTLIDFLLGQGATELVIACHTISSLLPQLDIGNATVYNIISPTLNYLEAQDQEGHLLFIGTRTTIESGCYQPAFLKPGQASYISAVELATLIEKEGPGHEKTLGYLKNLLQKHFDGLQISPQSITVFPVCTHYFLVKQHLIEFMQYSFPNASIGLVEPSGLLAERIPIQGHAGEGRVEIFLNEDKNPQFDQRLGSILQLLDLENDLLKYIQL